MTEFEQLCADRDKVMARIDRLEASNGPAHLISEQREALADILHRLAEHVKSR